MRIHWTDLLITALAAAFIITGYVEKNERLIGPAILMVVTFLISSTLCRLFSRKG